MRGTTMRGHLVSLSLTLLLFSISVIGDNRRTIKSRSFREETSIAIFESHSLLASSSSLEEAAAVMTLQESSPSFKSMTTTSARNITAQNGHSVFLHCIVEPIGEKMVSWIRLRDFHLLTVSDFTYTSDERFVVRHSFNDWALSIKHVTPSDEGLYECQVNTDPPRSQLYRLSVLTPKTSVLGSPSDLFVRKGESLVLKCLLTDSPDLPSLVFWYRNDRMINYDLDGESSITLMKDLMSENSVVSKLSIKSARITDSGNYSCHFVGSTSDPASIYVHVLQGKSSSFCASCPSHANCSEQENRGRLLQGMHLFIDLPRVLLQCKMTNRSQAMHLNPRPRRLLLQSRLESLQFC